MYNPEKHPDQAQAFPLERHRNRELELGLLHLDEAVGLMKANEIAPVVIPMPFDRQPSVEDQPHADWMSNIRRTIDEEAA